MRVKKIYIVTMLLVLPTRVLCMDDSTEFSDLEQAQPSQKIKKIVTPPSWKDLLGLVEKRQSSDQSITIKPKKQVFIDFANTRDENLFFESDVEHVIEGLKKLKKDNPDGYKNLQAQLIQLAMQEKIEGDNSNDQNQLLVTLLAIAKNTLSEKYTQENMDKNLFQANAELLHKKNNQKMYGIIISLVLAASGWVSTAIFGSGLNSPC